MYKTITSTLVIAYVNAIRLTKEETTAEVTETIKEAKENDWTAEEIGNWFEGHGKDIDAEDVREGIDKAAEEGFGLEEIEGLIDGAEASGHFDKHDIHDWVIDACEHFEVTEDGLQEMLHYAGEKLGINEEEGQQLLERVGEAFDISETEFNATMEECFRVGEKAAREGDREEKSGEKTEKTDKEGSGEKTEKTDKEGSSTDKGMGEKSEKEGDSTEKGEKTDKEGSSTDKDMGEKT